MKICVVGAGAIGGVLAFRLAAGGHDLSVLARREHLAAILHNGLTLVDHTRAGETKSVRVAGDSDPLRLAQLCGVQDVIFIALKAHAIGPILSRLAPLLGTHTTVIPAINGVPWWYFYRNGGAHDGAIVRTLDPHGRMFADLDCGRLLGCVVHAAAEVRAPGVVHHTGGRRFILGEIDRGLANPRSERLRAIVAALNDGGLDAIASDDIRFDVWTKLIGNLSFNPVAALTASLMDQICGNEALLAIIRNMLVEGTSVARRFGVAIEMTPDQRIDLARQLGSAKISMHQDFEAHRTPEIDAITGAVIELARWVQVDVPTVCMLDALVRARARNLGLLGGEAAAPGIAREAVR